MVDVAATREQFRARGLTIPGWARAKGLDPSKMPTRFYHGGKFTAAEEAALREDGLLVEKKDAE